jgi:methionyl-tRNA synthetase
LAKDPEQAGRLDAVLATLILSARTAATLLLPVAPDAANEILRQLALDPVPIVGEIVITDLPEGYVCGEPSPVFPRLELPVGEDAAA